MNEKRYPVHLSAEHQQHLYQLIRTGKATAHQQMAARVLLKADEANEHHLSSSQIAQALEISPRTVIRIKARFVQQGLQAALTGNYPKERPLRRKVDGRVEAHLIALACGPAPLGQRRWTMQLLADRVVDLGIVAQISDETVRLAPDELRPWLKRQWCFARPGSEFVWRMEDVLDVYCRPYNEHEPRGSEKHPCEPAKAGQDRREDYTNEKKGQRNLFIACEPLGGKRYLKVIQRRTKKDWAYFIAELLTVHYPTASKVILVLDNLNTHTPASLYDTFPPEKAKGLLDRLEIPYTPKHASWLNIAEIELSVLAHQGLEHTIATVDDLCERVQSWQAYRNHHMATVRLPVYHG